MESFNRYGPDALVLFFWNQLFDPLAYLVESGIGNGAADINATGFSGQFDQLLLIEFSFDQIAGSVTHECRSFPRTSFYRNNRRIGRVAEPYNE